MLHETHLTPATSTPLPPLLLPAGEAIRGSGVQRDQLVATKWGIHMSGEGQFVTDSSRQHCR